MLVAAESRRLSLFRPPRIDFRLRADPVSVQEAWGKCIPNAQNEFCSHHLMILLIIVTSFFSSDSRTELIL